MEQCNLSRAPEECLARCAVDGLYLDTFYQLLFRNHPEFERRFAGVDMDQQKKRLSETLPRFLQLPTLPADAPEVAEAIERHRHTHRGEARFAAYDAWIATVCQTLRQHDPLYSDEIEREVRQRLTRAVEIVRGASTAQ